MRVGEVCRDVVVVFAPDGGVPPLPVGVPVRVARDDAADRGPLAGVVAGLRAAASELALVVAGDMPDLQTAVLAELVRRAAEGSSGAIALREGDRVRPLPCVVRVGAAAAAAAELLDAGTRRLRDLLDALGVMAIDEETWRALDPDGRTLLDVDEPRDLDA